MPIDLPPCEPDVICAIVREVERSDWPHPITPVESKAITKRVLRTYGAPRSAVLCKFPNGTPSRTNCGVRWFNARGKITQSFFIGVKIWEDGSYVFFTRGVAYAP